MWAGRAGSFDLCARRSTSCNEMGPAGVALGAILSGLPDLRVFVMECAPPRRRPARPDVRGCSLATRALVPRPAAPAPACGESACLRTRADRFFPPLSAAQACGADATPVVFEAGNPLNVTEHKA